MNDSDLRLALLNFQKNHGASITFIASTCGVSREHVSRWLRNEHYVISMELKTKIKLLIKGEM